MTQKKITENPWTVEHEKGHPSSTLEWWAVIGFFTTQENQNHWSIKATLSEGGPTKKQSDSLYNITLFDQAANHHYIIYKRKTGVPLQSRQDAFDIAFNDSFMNGAYPEYHTHIRDSEQDIEIDIIIHAESLPHWVAQDATEGWIPMGLGFFRYGFIPQTSISGTIKIRGESFTIKGTGYFEHVWGNFSSHNPLSSFKDINKTLSTYMRIIGWWLRKQKTRIPTTRNVAPRVGSTRGSVTLAVTTNAEAPDTSAASSCSVAGSAMASRPKEVRHGREAQRQHEDDPADAVDVDHQGDVERPQGPVERRPIEESTSVPATRSTATHRKGMGRSSNDPVVDWSRARRLRRRSM